jgi:hypothetical protein
MVPGAWALEKSRSAEKGLEQAGWVVAQKKHYPQMHDVAAEEDQNHMLRLQEMAL